LGYSVVPLLRELQIFGGGVSAEEIERAEPHN
jgi:hypothetical protein